MPASFFTLAWPLVTTILVLAGFIVSIAAVTTLVAAITRARLTAKESQAQKGTDAVDQSDHPSRRSSPHLEFPTARESAVMETVTTDGVHFIPVP